MVSYWLSKRDWPSRNLGRACVWDTQANKSMMTYVSTIGLSLARKRLTFISAIILFLLHVPYR